MSRCNHCRPVPEGVRQAAGLLEGRWTVSILWASYEGASRFNEFKQAVGEIPPRTLAQRLVELEEAGVLERRVVDARPPRVEYTLTPEGRRLQAVVDALVSTPGSEHRSRTAGRCPASAQWRWSGCLGTHASHRRDPQIASETSAASAGT